MPDSELVLASPLEPKPAERSVPALRVGRVLGRAFTIYFRRFLVFLPFGVIPALQEPVTHWLHLERWAGGVTPVLDLALSLVLATICEAAVVQGTFDAMRERRVRLVASAARGLARPGVVVGVSLIQATSFLLGSALLLVPGLLAATWWFVAIPACIAERRGVLASLRRSAELSRGSRWRVFAIFLLILLAALVGNDAVPALLAYSIGATAAQIALFLWGTLYSSLQAVISVVTYHDLRVAKDGVETDRIAAVFD
jgi:hypothetical protein